MSRIRYSQAAPSNVIDAAERVPMDRPRLKLAAFSVHLLTASGAAIGLFALLAAIDRQWPAMFALLAFALVVDAVDGPLARRLKLPEVLPRWSGDVLDLVVDFLNYVVVPALAIATAGLLPPLFAIPAAAIIVISSALYFADRRMKTDDSYFRGFPAAWNLIAFYLFLLKPDPWIALVSIALFIALTFVPVIFIHPLRVSRLRPLNIVLCAIWGVLAIFVLIHDFSAPQWVVYGLVAIGIYFLVAGLSRGIASRTT
jgi:phosphatidylcholine synthase